MKRPGKRFVLSLLLVVVLLSSSCQSLLKLTYQNEDFTWLNSPDLSKLVIQSTRDKGFRFVVTDETTMKELYDSLSSAMPVKEKNTLMPDYIFEFSSYDNKVRRYSYVAGTASEDDGGNFYGDDGTWHVLNRIDTMIFNNLYTLRKPRDFFNGYYGAILEAVKGIQKDYGEKQLGVMINEDKEMLKFQMSFEILEFNLELNRLGAMPVDSEKDAEVVMNIRTRGYAPDRYKAVVEVTGGGVQKKKTYYITGNYVEEAWQIKVSADRPEDF